MCLLISICFITDTVHLSIPIVMSVSLLVLLLFVSGLLISPLIWFLTRFRKKSKYQKKHFYINDFEFFIFWYNL